MLTLWKPRSRTWPGRYPPGLVRGSFRAVGLGPVVTVRVRGNVVKGWKDVQLVDPGAPVEMELPHRNAGMGSAVGENPGPGRPPAGAQEGRVTRGQCAHRATPPPWSQNGAHGPQKMGRWAGKTGGHFSYTGLRVI